jgi:hypothetical protein
MSKAVVVQEFADQSQEASKQAPLPKRPPYQNPPSLTRATAAIHQYPQPATPQQPRIWTISNRRRSLQALVLDTSACQIVNTRPMQLATQLWPKLMFPGKLGNATFIYIDLRHASGTPNWGYHLLTTNRCCRCLSQAAR